MRVEGSGTAVGATTILSRLSELTAALGVTVIRSLSMTAPLKGLFSVTKTEVDGTVPVKLYTELAPRKPWALNE